MHRLLRSESNFEAEFVIGLLQIHHSVLCRHLLVFPPHPCKGGLYLFLEASDQFAVGGERWLVLYSFFKAATTLLNVFRMLHKCICKIR